MEVCWDQENSHWSLFFLPFSLNSLSSHLHTHTHMFSVNWMQHHGCGPPRWFPQGRPTHPTCLQAPPTGWQTTITAAGICVVEYSHQQWSVPKSSWLMPLKQLQGKNQFLTVLNSREILILDKCGLVWTVHSLSFSTVRR